MVHLNIMVHLNTYTVKYCYIYSFWKWKRTNHCISEKM